MNLVLLLPAALAALGMLLLPLLLHLARRDERRPVDFAALRWLRSLPRPRRRIRFEEWPLLLLRLLLLALLALWLARPAWHGGGEGDWIVAMPGLDPARVRAQAGETQATLRWLAPGFPPMEEPAPASTDAFPSLLRQLDAGLPAGANLTVFVPARLQGADGARLRLSREVQWRILGEATPGAAQESVTDSTPPTTIPALVVRYDAEREPALRYLRAAVRSWHPATGAGVARDLGTDADRDRDPDPVAGAGTAADPVAPTTFAAAAPEQPLPPHARHLVWLVPGELPAAIGAWIEDGGVALLDADTRFELPDGGVVLWRDGSGEALVEGAPLGRGRVMRLTRALAPATLPQLLDAGFPAQLRALFEPPAPAPSRVAAADYLPGTGAAAWPLPPRDLQPWLALLIGLLFLLERWFASGRRNGAVP